MKNYNDYLNMLSPDKEKVIRNVVYKQMNLISGNDYSYEGVCKLVANNIKCDLKDENIESYLVDLNQYGFDHVSLIAEYYHDGLKRFLIDPSIVQFKINLESYFKNKDFLLELEENGYVLLNDDIFKRYISMFVGKNIGVNLDNFIDDILNNRSK